MNWPIRFLIPLFLILAAAQIGRLQADERDDDVRGADLSRLVIVGDSISAGHQNSCLLNTQQPNSYASLLARQARVDLPLPLMGAPGLPPCLELASLDPLIIERSSVYPGFRIDPTVQAFNLSVPGMRIVDAQGTAFPSDFREQFFGFPFSLIHQQVLLGHPDGLSQIDIAERLMPTTVVLWLGSNDVLWALIGANPAFITPESYFQYAFHQVLSRLVGTGATVVVGNVPSINSIPFATPAEEVLVPLSESTGISVQILGHLLGIGPGDFVTLPGLPLIEEILQTPGSDPLPPEVVLTAEEAAQIQAAVDAYNAFISSEVESLRVDGFAVALVDTDAMLKFVDENGLRLGHRKLTTDF
ncbi:MAG: hypothetical protein R3337_01615, partial [Gammaproteobacteria bacterium]|nr:hypothetical protein [Gammaproteobacteria bacterium]